MLSLFRLSLFVASVSSSSASSPLLPVSPFADALSLAALRVFPPRPSAPRASPCCPFPCEPSLSPAHADALLLANPKRNVAPQRTDLKTGESIPRSRGLLKFDIQAACVGLGRLDMKNLTLVVMVWVFGIRHRSLFRVRSSRRKREQKRYLYPGFDPIGCYMRYAHTFSCPAVPSSTS